MSFWDDRYSRDEYVFGEAPNAFLAAQSHLLPKSGKALAIADGEGRNGVWLAEQGLDVLSLDASPVGLEKAKSSPPNAASNSVPSCSIFLTMTGQRSVSMSSPASSSSSPGRICAIRSLLA